MVCQNLLYISANVCVCVCMSVYVCMYVCACVCIHVYFVGLNAFIYVVYVLTI